MKSKRTSRYATKILALILSMLMLLGAMPVAFAATPVAPEVYEWPTVDGKAELFIGQNLSNLKLVGGSAAVDGHFDWSTPDSTSVNVGVVTPAIYFYPDDTVNYKKVRGKGSVTYIKSTEAKVVGTLSVNPLLPGRKLSEAEFIKSDDFAMTSYDTTYNTVITWENPDKVMEQNGTFSEKVIVKATNKKGIAFSEDVINSVELTVNVTVEGSASDFVEVKESPVASEIELGQTLADSVLTGGVVTKGGNPVAGKFEWKDASVVPEFGTKDYTVVFTPEDSAVCEPQEMQVSVTTVRPELKIIEWPEINAPYMYGKRLYECVKLGEGGKASVPGRFYIVNDELYQAKVPESINDTVEINVVFYPDGYDYQSVTKKIAFKFDKLDADCYASVKIDDYSNSNVVTASVSGWVRNKSSWAQHTGKFYYTLDGVTTESDDNSFSAKYNYTNLAPGQHTFSCEYVAGENDVYTSSKSEEVTFEIIKAYTVTVTDCTGTYVKGDYRPGNSVSVSAAKHEKAYYDFSGWTAEGAEITTHTDFAYEYVTVTMPEGDIHLTANYKFNIKLFLEDSFTKVVVWLKDIFTQGIEWIKGLRP